MLSSNLDTMPFSRSGLIEQLEYEGYPTDAATVAADSLNEDWAAQAVRHAKQYTETMPFSLQGLIDQLVYEGYSQDEATHGATAVLG